MLHPQFADKKIPRLSFEVGMFTGKDISIFPLDPIPKTLGAAFINKNKKVLVIKF